MPGAASPALPPTTRDLVERGCSLLGLEGIDVVEVSSAGQSGSPVVSVTVQGGSAVLKVLTDPSRLSRARLELDLYTEPMLADFRPRLLAGGSDEGAVFLLVELLSSFTIAEVGSHSRWVELAESVGSLQSAPIARALRAVPARRRTRDEIQSRRGFWVDRCGAAVADRAMAILVAQVTSTEPQGAVMMHGDCHVENAVTDRAGRVRWVDWQETRLGSGLADLVFLWQRAEFQGACPPRAGMLDAYVSSRGMAVDGRLRREFALVELELVFAEWPAFLAYGPRSAQQRLTERVSALLSELR